MPQIPNELAKRAQELFRQGMKLVDISKELNVPAGTVRRWKNTYQWESERSLSNPNVRIEEPKKKGGQPGNQNAVGHGAPKGNKNSYVHGIYSNPTFDMIPEELKERFLEIDFTDEESLLIQGLFLLTIRERQLLESIQKYQDQKNGLSLDGVTRRTVESEGVKGSRSKQVETTTRTRDVFDVIQKLQAELTKVQKEKRQHLNELRLLKTEKARVEHEMETGILADVITEAWERREIKNESEI